MTTLRSHPSKRLLAGAAACARPTSSEAQQRACAPGGRLRHRCRRDGGHHGAVRIGQEHPHAHPRAPARPGASMASRPSSCSTGGTWSRSAIANGPGSGPGDGVRVPGLQPGPDPDAVENVVLAADYAGNGGAAGGPPPSRRWTGSGSPSAPVIGRPSSPEGSSNAWRSREPWSTGLVSCWPTNRPATSIRSDRRRCSRSSGAPIANRGRPSSS